MHSTFYEMSLHGSPSLDSKWPLPINVHNKPELSWACSQTKSWTGLSKHSFTHEFTLHAFTIHAFPMQAFTIMYMHFLCMYSLYMHFLCMHLRYMYFLCMYSLIHAYGGHELTCFYRAEYALTYTGTCLTPCSNMFVQFRTYLDAKTYL